MQTSQRDDPAHHLHAKPEFSALETTLKLRVRQARKYKAKLTMATSMKNTANGRTTLESS